MKLKNIVVATEKKGYYNILEQSCKRYNIEIIPLGMGEEWTGFTKKFYLWRDYLEKLDDNEIIMINDAYDVIILEDADTIIKKFKSFNKNIVFGHQNDIISRLVFPTCNVLKYVLCSGNIIGYVKYLKQLIKLIFEQKEIWGDNTTDQIILNNICKKETDFFKNNITVDKQQLLFFITAGSNYFYNYMYKKIPNIYMKNNKLYTNNNITPSILHLAGDLDGTTYIKYLKYTNIPENSLLKIQPYKKKQLYKYLNYTIKYNKKSIFLSILTIAAYLYFFKVNKRNLIIFLLVYIFIFNSKVLLLPFILLLSIIIFLINLY